MVVNGLDLFFLNFLTYPHIFKLAFHFGQLFPQHSVFFLSQLQLFLIVLASRAVPWGNFLLDLFFRCRLADSGHQVFARDAVVLEVAITVQKLLHVVFFDVRVDSLLLDYAF